MPSQVFKRFGPSALRSEERTGLRNQFSLNRLIHLIAMGTQFFHTLMDLLN